MSDVFPIDKRSKIMAAIRGKNSIPEMAVRQLVHALGYLRTDSASLRFFRQRIASLLSPRTDSASLRWVAEATAVRDGPALVRSRCSAGCVRETLLVATRETAGMGGETRPVRLHYR